MLPLPLRRARGIGGAKDWGVHSVCQMYKGVERIGQTDDQGVTHAHSFYMEVTLLWDYRTNDACDLLCLWPCAYLNVAIRGRVSRACRWLCACESSKSSHQSYLHFETGRVELACFISCGMNFLQGGPSNGMIHINLCNEIEFMKGQIPQCSMCVGNMQSTLHTKGGCTRW